MAIEQLIKKLTFRIRRTGWRALTAIQSERIYSFTLPDGGRFDYPLSSAIGECLYSGWFEPGEVAFVRKHLKANDVVLDVGANAGLYTVIAARAVGAGGHVYAFEPDPRALALLRNNIAINNLTNVTIIEAAVSNRTGEAPFGSAGDTAMSSLAEIQREDRQAQQWHTVNTIRLDDAVEIHGIRAATFIKLDVEGAEKLALEGALNLMSMAPAGFTILFEAFDQNTGAFGYTAHDLVNTLTGQGFRLSGFDHAQQLQPVEALRSEIGKTVYNFVAQKN